MDGVFSTNHKALDLFPLDLIPVSPNKRIQKFLWSLEKESEKYKLRTFD